MWIEKDVAVIYLKECFDYVSSRSFLVSSLSFRSLIHFELIFVYEVKEWSNFYFLNTPNFHGMYLKVHLLFPLSYIISVLFVVLYILYQSISALSPFNYVALQKELPSERISAKAPPLLFTVVLAVLSPVPFHINFRMSWSSS